ncbi:MAG: NAD-binding protein, partial [Verrucomicrobia bacterium]|nr:NAD-binding protein [Verrucomicrobiota bacterium]
MKYLPSQLLFLLQNRAGRRNVVLLGKFISAFAGIVTIYSVLFHVLMAREGQEHTWITGFYWTLTVMSTLGFGDITFHTDLGRLFSILVLVSGSTFMLILLPFTFIEFFYSPWMKAQQAARVPLELPPDAKGHVVLTHLDTVTAALIQKLDQFHYPYVLLVADINEAQTLLDDGYRVVVGALDDPESYSRVRVDRAALVVSTGADVTSTNVAFTVRETNDQVPIISLARSQAGQDVLRLAGCNHVLRLGEMMGQFLSRRVMGGDALTHIIGKFDELLIAETLATGTPLVGKTLAETRLRESTGVTVVGLWERGRFQVARPETKVTASSVLVMAGSRDQLRRYDELFCIYHAIDAPVTVLGGGRVGRATARALRQRQIECRIVEKLPGRVPDDEETIIGDAADPKFLEQAGLLQSPSVVITPRDDDLNIYLTILCRKLHPDIQIISRATLDRNVNSLHRAGADFVASYASMGANAIFNLLQRGDVLMVAEGLDVFKVTMPEALGGRSIADSNVRQETGCTIVAL